MVYNVIDWHKPILFDDFLCPDMYLKKKKKNAIQQLLYRLKLGIVLVDGCIFFREIRTFRFSRSHTKHTGRGCCGNRSYFAVRVYYIIYRYELIALRGVKCRNKTK